VRRPVHPAEIAPAARFALPGTLLELEQARILTTVVAEGAQPIVYGSPVQLAEGEPVVGAVQVRMATEPGPILGLAVRPERAHWGDEAEPETVLDVLTTGVALVPTGGPIDGTVLYWDQPRR